MNTIPYDLEERQKAKMLPDRRVFTLKPIEGLKPLTSSGMVDPRLFTGESQLFAVYDPQKGVWFLRSDGGSLPGGLQGQFTEYGKLVEYITSYYLARNVSVKSM